MAKMPIPTPNTLCQRLRYEPETGLLYWLEQTPERFTDGSKVSAKVRCGQWNTRFANKEAFTAISPSGYRFGKMGASVLLAHRAIWAMVYGEWPDQIDHINGDRLDNRLTNIRNVTTAENNRNMKIGSNNTSGRRGVYFSNRSKRWIARIWLDGRTKHVGTFVVKEDAFKARKDAEIKYGFHANHGRV